MGLLLDRRRSPTAAIRDQRSPSRHVLLGTLGVRVELSAENMAIDTALEVGAKLILADVLPLPPYPLTAILAPEWMALAHEEDLEAVRATAQRAASLGIATELLRARSPRPVTTLIELAHDREVGLLVFGPDRSRISRRQFRSAAKMVRRDAPCLVWVAPTG